MKTGVRSWSEMASQAVKLTKVKVPCLARLTSEGVSQPLLRGYHEVRSFDCFILFPCL